MDRLASVTSHLRQRRPSPSPAAAAAGEQQHGGGGQQQPLPLITLGDLSGTAANAASFPRPGVFRATLLVFVAGDCPVCGEVWPAIAALAAGFGAAAASSGGGGAAVHVISQDPELALEERRPNRRLATGVFLPHHETIGFPVRGGFR